MADTETNTKKTDAPSKVLVAVQAFGDYAIGDRITDAKAVEAILSSEQRAFVVVASN